MKPKRVLFFGVTGVQKTGLEGEGAVERFAQWVHRHRNREKPRVIDFEREYLFNRKVGGKEAYSFLNETQENQRAIWLRTWSKFEADFKDDQPADLFVSIHGCVVRGHYGVRSVIDPQAVATCVHPDLIVTLLDDVYDMWWRTEHRAKGEDWLGRPTIEQLVFARRTELLIADQVAYTNAPSTPNFMVSVSHPCDTLANRVYSPDPTIVYLCFPISAPKDLAAEGDHSGTKEVTAFLKRAYDEQRRNPDLVVVCPLGIDELPLVFAAQDATGQNLEFDRDSLRWPVDTFWSSDDSLSSGPPTRGDRTAIPVVQIMAAAGMIETDVGWRDYRLVEQVGESGCLAAFNPKFRNREDLSRSVREEIRFAAGTSVVFVFQDKDHDPSGMAMREFAAGGTMPPSPGAQMVVMKDSLDSLFQAVAEHTRR